MYLHLYPVWAQVSPDHCGFWNWDAAFFFWTLPLLAQHLCHPEERSYNHVVCVLCTGQVSRLPTVLYRLTGFCGFVMAQVITVETKMNIFRDLKFSISEWRAVCKRRKMVRDQGTLKLVHWVISLLTPIPVIAHVASSTCCCVALSEMLYTTTSHCSRRSRSSSRVGDYQKRINTQLHVVCNLHCPEIDIIYIKLLSSLYAVVASKGSNAII